MIYWAPLLHFYQPPTQLHWVLRKVCDESYRPLVELFRSLPYAKVTVNINAVLAEMLYDHRFRWFMFANNTLPMLLYLPANTR